MLPSASKYAMMAANGSNYIKSNSLDYAGAYFLTSKAGNTNTSNRLILVYKANATVDNTETKFKDTFDYYYAGCFDNIMILPDGRFVKLQNVSGMSPNELKQTVSLLLMRFYWEDIRILEPRRDL